MSWLFDLAYVALLVVVSPILLWRVVIRGKYRRDGAKNFWAGLFRGIVVRVSLVSGRQRGRSPNWSQSSPSCAAGSRASNS